jgi:hypothetical protein
MRKLVIVGYPEQKCFQRTLERRCGTQRLEFSGRLPETGQIFLSRTA